MFYAFLKTDDTRKYTCTDNVSISYAVTNERHLQIITEYKLN